ncbi:hypothetical protein OIU85_007043 [Salix viminalis]|uniref:mitogen-activated protein kinase kinase kinase n=1 Tax=Salix viminalis TaxID=40686 RepID=A0A9Q0P8C5_SALVM|nr:hypothetical protein OIU85_007043 [Salix viminalis]
MVSPIRLRVPSISLSNSEDDLTDQREMLSERHLRLAADDLAAFFARIHPHLAGQPLRLREKDARAILEMLGLRPIQNEENIAVPSPQDCLEQLLEVIARINLESDANSPARTICTPRPEITDWERGDCIGKGSFGSVYKGYSKEHKLFFAAKGVPLDEDGHICHLENEIAILKPLDHKNIIQFYGTERGGKMLYIFIELVSQGTLEQAYKDFRFDESQVSNYTRQILQGLTHLHSRNVVHGDLKCANILVTESGRIKLVLLSSPMVSPIRLRVPSISLSNSEDDLTDQREMLSERHLSQPLRSTEKTCSSTLRKLLGLRPIQNEENIAGRIKLADFGLSKSMEDHSQSLELGLRSSFWMAPEVANPKRGGYGFPSDIWSLGCTVTELSTRKYPQYNGRDNVSLALAIRRGKGPVVPDYLSDTLKDFINQCLQPDPKQRPTAAELLAHPFVNGTILDAA